MSSGMTMCKCRDCFEETMSNDELDPDFCQLCEEAGCEADKECQGLHSYAGFDHESGGDPLCDSTCAGKGKHTHEDPAPLAHHW